MTRLIPEWADLRVAERADDGSTRLVEPHRPMQIRDLMMHTAGLGYGRDNADLDLDVGDGERAPATRLDDDLETMVARLAASPLRFHPGTRWLYSLGIDVCGRLVEILSGRRFDEFLAERGLRPAGNGGYRLLGSRAGRRPVRGELFTQLPQGADAGRRPEGELLPDATDLPLRRGRAGVDHCRLSALLPDAPVRRRGGRAAGAGAQDHRAHDHQSLAGRGSARRLRPAGGYGEVGFEGMGFGLTMAVSQGPAETGAIGTRGEYMWGGAASTIFWVDPAEELIVVFMTQLLPSGTFNFRGQLKALVYPAIVDWRRARNRTDPTPPLRAGRPTRPGSGPGFVIHKARNTRP